ncbi:Protein of unknown function precursor; putative adhesin [Flavobacterium indicum GPTSA100-9 = DSM 17447]|uniref:Fibronectin type-III domain-containing protein n=1 Tax=Flavobacterium indicum (strain DSM 17447 / CIP 109464 / GPTSA100-9) TaxID=1094466 RepID=H8XPP8_FLAIG|nr:GEVED domain-containing protein [Flavobacterium indicum]CCG54114.1 Protein of unknown function precursor; putative adhesin [Flavobacterium indicum GPTSA100-9 = DSM 17447]
MKTKQNDFVWTERSVDKIFKFFFTLLCALNFGNINSQTVETFNTAGTGSWVCPAGVTSIKVEAWGGGGGGGYARSTNRGAGGGGGGGAYTVSNTIAVVPGTTYYYRVGSGGTGGTAAGTAATPGQSSCFSTATNCGGTILASANGGGAGGSVTTNAPGTAGAGGSGGTFTSGSFNGGNGAAGSNGNGGGNGGGGGGGGAGTTANGGNASVLTGGTGATLYGGNGGNGVNSSSGNSGLTVGGGGAGGHRMGGIDAAGGNGANGQIIISYAGYCTLATTSSTYWISNFTTTLGLTNINNTSTYSAGGYGNYTAQSVSQIATGSFNFSVTLNSGTHGVNIWVDWNNDLDFNDAGEKVYASGGYVSSASGTITIPGGTPVGNYRMRVVADYLNTDPTACGTTTYTEGEDYTLQVATPPTCYTPTSLSASATSTTTGTASWTAPTLGTTPIGYQYVISTSNTTPGGAGTAVATTSVNFTGLLPNTTYYVFVRTNCGSGDFSSWVSTSFYTGYCSSTSTTSTYFINNFSTTGGTLNITNNGSGYSATGYGNFSAQVVSQQPFGSVNFSIALNSTYTFGVNIWIDWNGDLDFNDAGEKVYASGSYVNTATGVITVPGTAVAGNYRMRVVANYSSTDPLSCGSISNGETEDYTFTVLPSACPGIPTAVVVGPVTTTTATVNWTASSPAPASGYQYYLTTSATLPTGATVPTGSTAAGVTTVNLTGLTPNTTYYVYIRNNCGSGNVSPWTSQVSFYTGYCVSNSSSSTYFINNFSTTSGTTNITNNGSGYSAGGYGNFTAQTVTQAPSGSVNFSIALNSTNTFGVNIWVDWNNDMDFNDSGELVYASGAYVNTATGIITVPATAIAGNYRMRIVANYSSSNPSSCGTITSGETEDYTFNVTTLPCNTYPIAITTTPTSMTSTTISWSAPTPAPASGYQYYISTSSTVPTAGTAPTGTVGAGVTSVNVTGLVSNTTYYVYVRTNCGGSQGVWSGPSIFTQPNCMPGGGTGTSTLGCPSVVSGGLGLSGTDPAPISCGSSGCVDLEATYLHLGQTTSYTVQSIGYAPPYQFDCLANQVSVNVDDTWSPIINLPFNFCFYGTNYNQCLMGSNGLITFDTTNNTPGGYCSYSFADNIPIAGHSALVENAIFGVFHDIDPSKGGKVAWELITLNTGCRALVASWHDIPMFSASCNSILYTGMIVLYENTNVIEVYIENKQLCPTWNDGNAVVGIQDPTGTLASVAPNRNGLSADWTTTNEAWRFVPSGASITSLKWHEGSGTSGPVVGTTDVINVCPAGTTTYTAEVTYTLCNGTTLVETDEVVVTVSSGKTWNGSVSTNWNVANNWTPVGVPTSADCVLIPNVTNKPIISGTNYSGLARTVTVQNGATLTITATNALTVTDVINVSAGGQILVNNNGSIVQINNVTNVGNITYERTANIRKQDYVYWSSPVNNFPVTSVSPGTNAGFIYKWQPTTTTAYASNFGNWVNANENMVIGKGYIVRGPDSFTTTLQNYTATFTGVPNNGNITVPISRSTYNGANYTGPTSTLVTKDDDNWNLIGNPYPSSIHAINFLTLNTNIAGFIKVWTHGTLPSSAIADPFYSDFVYNYTPGDYITYNSTGTSSGPGVFNGYIAGGQGFFVLMNHTSAGTSETVSFNNTLRSNTYSNSQFFRTNNAQQVNADLERHRIWLDLISSNGNSIRTLVGYIQGATNSEDRLNDAFTDEKLNFNLYSLIEDKMMTIQGRTLPFDNNDQVPLGLKVNQAGMYTIGVGVVDGLFTNANQKIYLEDKLLNIIYDIKQSAYTFISEAGTFNNRFVLRYTTKSDAQLSSDNSISVFTNNSIAINSNKLKIKDVQVYDVLGKLILNKSNINKVNIELTEIMKANGVLLVKITLEDNTVYTKKIIY